MIEETQVVIVGAGPAGLTFGLCLAQYQITSVILEKEREVTTDPRGVYLTGDAIRILCSLGLHADLAKIGHVVETIHYHVNSFSTKPYFSVGLAEDSLHQSLPNGLLQSQPQLEHALRRQVTLSKWCTLRTGCEVTGQYRAEPPVVEYLDEHGTPRRIQGSWLIGADGKVGIVRKHFLEPTTGIRQQRGSYDYTGTWVAANLKITPPTPQTHPKFPLWQLGYTPDQVYNLFWPEGWHFCCPPGKATATGRFGAYHERLWRHEFCQDDWHDEMDAVRLFWEHITPMITRGQDTDGYKLPEQVQFPRDCVEILRCRPFRFVHKVVNRWFDGRVVLIGDAAHVFPPFAGQGIGSGVRDAQQLAWRLALMLSQPQISNLTKSNILDAWTLERRHSVDAAAYMSMLNGTMIN
ncbi:hypothetical protein BKA67DRAFT_209369 [Truncatella angustata]|uniref:FAD-binding domain-containing protein n=1 Tax=Truncatella angustata TaxID=152316 RepID=A0A9P8UUH8_9PEZI|nr:uncharacterized protein BKA67DRAFT_209369 [Truncatella angustata]KAH6658245.1 hypothetical protein BKA67DRAFT_209369 [Truncatella angustata]